MDKRIRFEKTGILKFIGHLDLLRTFQRAFRRAEVPLAYSKGFNPHPLLSFANPLGLGMTSEDEYADITLDQNMDNEEIIRRMNEQLPPGLKLLDCKDLPEHAPTVMSIVTASEYIITLPSGLEDWTETIAQFLQSPQIMIRKLGKIKGRKTWMDLDVKPLIYEYEMLSPDTMRFVCACGSMQNLKVDAFLESLYSFVGHPEWTFEEKIHRTHLYQTVEGSLCPIL